jgi:FKBP-type peptidyl-prolyl cis-trans isomerase FklB
MQFSRKFLAITLLGPALCIAAMYACAADGQTSPTISPITGSQLPMQTTPTIAEKNKTAGEAFLAANRTQPGVITLPDGLQYKVIKEGAGPTPTAQDTVTVNYTGTLIDGTEFDSSYKRGEPATFPVSGVIAGWTEALQLMKVGSTWMLYVPAPLAYGPAGAPPVIGPNQTLVFKVELLAIKK